MLTKCLWPKRQILAAFCVYIGMILVGFGTGWPAPVLPKLQDPEQTPLPSVISDQDASWVGSFFFIGAIIGITFVPMTATFKMGLRMTSSHVTLTHCSLFKFLCAGQHPQIQFLSPHASSFLSNVVGRKPCLLLGGLVTGLAFLVMALANNLAMILAGRIIIGLGLGIIFIMNLVYIGEIASTPIRGILLTMTAVFNTLGTLIAFSVGPYVSYVAIAYIGLAISLIYIAGILYIPETPLFLVLKGNEEKAKQTLVFLNREEDFDTVLFSKQEIEKSKTNKWTEVVTVKSNRNALFITITLHILQQISGILTITTFITTIFQRANMSLDSNIATILVGVMQFLTCCLVPLFVERSGRKLLMLFSTAACSVSLGLLGMYFYLDDIKSPVAANINWLPLVTLITYSIGYAFGFGIIPGTFIGEMFTPSARSVGATISLTTSWLVAFAMVTAFGYMLQWGTYVVFWVYTVASVVAFVFTIVVVPETKGKSLFEVQEMLSR